jgi:hypothetical protein
MSRAGAVREPETMFAVIQDAADHGRTSTCGSVPN